MDKEPRFIVSPSGDVDDLKARKETGEEAPLKSDVGAEDPDDIAAREAQERVLVIDQTAFRAKMEHLLHQGRVSISPLEFEYAVKFVEDELVEAQKRLSAGVGTKEQGVLRERIAGLNSMMSAIQNRTLEDHLEFPEREIGE